MELRRQDEYSSTTIFQNTENFYKLSETSGQDPWTDDDDQGDVPNVKVAETPCLSPFSVLLQFFRIFLLVYHSVKWNEIQQTTGQSRQQSKSYEDFDLCE
jgi:hypothetical protein